MWSRHPITTDKTDQQRMVPLLPDDDEAL
jgi:hypothetical protein